MNPPLYLSISSAVFLSASLPPVSTSTSYWKLSLPASSPGVPTILIWLRPLYSSWVSHPHSPSQSRFSLCLFSFFQSLSSTHSSPLSEFYSPLSLSCSMSPPHTTVSASTLPLILLSSPLCSYIYLSRWGILLLQSCHSAQSYS